MTSDGELIRRAAGGDRSAFEDLYRRFARPVFGLALRRLGDRGQAEDAVRTTFASVQDSAGSYRPDRGPGGPWLYTVALTAIGSVEEPGPAADTDRCWAAWRVHRAVEELDDSERELIALTHWSALSQSEVAAFLGAPPGTVRTRARSALAHLADLLREEAS